MKNSKSTYSSEASSTSLKEEYQLSFQSSYSDFEVKQPRSIFITETSLTSLESQNIQSPELSEKYQNIDNKTENIFIEDDNVSDEDDSLAHKIPELFSFTTNRLKNFNSFRTDLQQKMRTDNRKFN